MRAHDADPRLSPRGTACVVHTFAVYLRAPPELVWTALTDADTIASFLYGLAAHSTWIPEAPIEFRRGDRIELTGRVLYVRRPEQLCYLLRSGQEDPPAYLTWRLRPVPGGCVIRLEVDEIEHSDSPEDAEDTWLPVLAALQQVVNSG
jgi:uncharacterized protein YndB with AHSA1/START domain